MKYKEKVDKFRKIIFQQNENGNTKWKNKEEFELYFVKFGGKLKHDRKRKKDILFVSFKKEYRHNQNITEARFPIRPDQTWF